LPTVTRVVVGRRIAEETGSYLRLLRGGVPAATFDSPGWIPVRLTSQKPSPWTNDTTLLEVSRTGAWLVRDGWIYRIAPELAERVRRGRSLTASARAG
jgi:hypothetical protein